MRIEFHPSKENLKKLQEELSAQISSGIKDIWDPVSDWHIAIMNSDEAIGVATIRKMESRAELYKLYVSPSSREKGVGRYLFKELISYLGEKGFKELFVEVYGDSDKFWEKIINENKERVTNYDFNKFGVRILS